MGSVHPFSPVHCLLKQQPYHLQWPISDIESRCTMGSSCVIISYIFCLCHSLCICWKPQQKNLWLSSPEKWGGRFAGAGPPVPPPERLLFCWVWAWVWNNLIIYYFSQHNIMLIIIIKLPSSLLDVFIVIITIKIFRKKERDPVNETVWGVLVAPKSWNCLFWTNKKGMSEIGCAGVKLQERPRSRSRQRQQPVKSRPQLQGQVNDRRLKDAESALRRKPIWWFI